MRSAKGRGRLARLLPVGLLLAACGDAGPSVTIEIQTPSTTQLFAGDFLELMAVTSGPSGPVTWASSDDQVAVVVNGTVEARRPGTVTVTASATDAVPDEIELTVTTRPNGYLAAEVDYFTEIAFGAEFGNSSPLLRRWRSESGPLMRVNGSPTAGDRAVLDGVIAELNQLSGLDIEIVADFPTVEMHFVPQSEFSSILPQAPAGNIGLVWLWWDPVQQHLERSEVLISTEVPEALRAHIIREEVTQMLGLLRDSFRYPQSIFYQDFSDVTEYAPIDRVVIELLHRPELTIGMGMMEAAQISRTLIRPLPGADFHATPPAREDRFLRAPSWWWAAVDPDAEPTSGGPASAGGSSGADRSAARTSVSGRSR